MPDAPTTTLTWGQLKLSPHNVRVHRPDAEATEALEKNLLAEGQLMPLVVHPFRGTKPSRPTYGVLAGGRRYRAFGKLIDRGDMPPDQAIIVRIVDGTDAELVAMSLAENMIRRDLQAYEEHAAIAKLVALGEDEESLAEQLGQEPRFIRRYARLGRLAKPIRQAFAEGAFPIEAARAFAAVEDHQLQLACFEHFSGMSAPVSWPDRAERIRTWYRIGDRELGRLLRFVGEDEYRAAGGRYELDLFAEEADQRGRVVDESILRQIAGEKLQAFRAGVRARVARPELRFLTNPPENNHGGRDYTLEYRGIGDSVPDGVAAFVELGDDCRPVASFWWESNAAKHGGARKATGSTLHQRMRETAGGAPAPANDGRSPAPASAPPPASEPSWRTGIALDDPDSPGEQQRADQAIKQDWGLTQDLIQIFRSLRRGVLRDLLVQNAREDGDVGLDLLVWSQLRLALTRDSWRAVGVVQLGNAGLDPLVANAHLEETGAGDVFRAELDAIGREAFLTEPDLVQAFLAFRRAAPALKNRAAALLTGLMLARSLSAGGYDIPVHGAVATETGLSSLDEQRERCQPTPALLALLAKAEIVAIGRPFVEPATAARWEKAKASEVAGAVHQVLDGTSAAIASDAARVEAQRWVHPLLRYGKFPPGTLAAAFDRLDRPVHEDDADLAEAAE